MPVLKGKRNQLTATESNVSRCVTLIRWAVKAVHGIIGQRCKLLHHQFDNHPKASFFCKIGCCLIPHFGKRLVSQTSASEEMLKRIIFQNIRENSMAAEVEMVRWARKRSLFQKLTANEGLDFPKLTECDLKVFFTGTCQLQHTISYLAEVIVEVNILSCNTLS